VSGRVNGARGRVIVVGGGVSGLAAAIDLAHRGVEVVLCDSAPTFGGKLRELAVGGVRVDSGPTVLTLREVFDALFHDAGAELDAAVTLQRADVLARHFWSASECLDLYADVERSAAAIAAFSSTAEAARFRGFAAHAQRLYATLEQSFLYASRPDPVTLVRRIGLGRAAATLGSAPFTSLMTSLQRQFRDPRLQQLFARYATYSGSSPYAAPATLLLIAHVEQRGVWLVEGGLQRLADALAQLARRRGAILRSGTRVQEIVMNRGRVTGVRLADQELLAAEAVLFTGDPGALATGGLGDAVAASLRLPALPRSMSALTWSLTARVAGAPLARHSVFFSRDYAAEFDALSRRERVPAEPTVYVCAQDRDATGAGGGGPTERLLCLVNAPAHGDRRVYSTAESAECWNRMNAQLQRCGLELTPTEATPVVTTPTQFATLFPGNGGALYGGAMHGWRAAFQRPGARTRLPGLYLAGGSIHPGPGLPMAALSGRLAATEILKDQASTRRSSTAAMSGGTSTR
jgi:1-hydroxycarotenoid 3,4-desaturase